MKEIWKDIKDYEGVYQVSNIGNVKSLSRWRVNGTTGYITKEKNLAKSDNGGGYLVVSLHKDKKQKNFKVHQLVAIAFLNHIPNGYNGLIVDHISNNKLDNRIENLQITSARHNSSKDKKGGTSKYIGVSWDKSKSKWVSNIYLNGKQKKIGLFTTELEASNAYQKALKEIIS